MRTIKATWPKPVSSTTRIVGTVCAVVILSMATGQLFEYDKMAWLIASGPLIDGMAAATIFVAVLAISEVLALPFLLGMKLSFLMRVVSMLCGYFTITYWLVAVVYQAAGAIPGNIGILGDRVAIGGSWWLVGAMAFLALIFTWYVAKSRVLQPPYHLENSPRK